MSPDDPTIKPAAPSPTVGLHQVFSNILADYLQAKDLTPAGKAKMTGIRITLDKAKSDLEALFKSKGYTDLSVSVKGVGGAADIPWISIMHQKETTNAMRGVYIVYLFKGDMSGLYLALNQGEGVGPSGSVNEEKLNCLKKNGAAIRNKIGALPSGMSANAIDLANDGNGASGYSAGTLLHKYYNATALPNDAALLADLDSLIDVYRKYVSVRPPYHWIFMIPTEKLEGMKYKSVWELCRKESLAAMEYPVGDKRASENRPLIQNIKRGDKVILYVSKSRVGGIGTVTKEFYEDMGAGNGLNGKYGQRIDLEWVLQKFGVSIAAVKPSLKEFPKFLITHTIHWINPETYDIILDSVKNGKEEDIGFTDRGAESKVAIEIDGLMEAKKQVILYGPPGTGKTYDTRGRALNAVLGQGIGAEDREVVNGEYNRLKKEGVIEFITFHPSYSYEEFVEGISVNLGSKFVKSEETQNSAIGLQYILKSGAFKIMACRALAAALGHEDPDDGNDDKLAYYSMPQLIAEYRATIDSFTQTEGKPKESDWWEGKPRFVLIIDEINRADISKVFGELITLLEADKRLGMDSELTARLPYSQEEFCVPPNLYIIGTMNTADKSIALIDVALRRRFGFIEMKVDLNALDVKHIKPHEAELKRAGVYAELIRSRDCLYSINKRICADRTVGRDRQIGHSFLFKVKTKDDLLIVWRNEILPLLEEYYYGNYSKINVLLFKEEIPKDPNNTWISEQHGVQGLKNYEALVKFLSAMKLEP